MSKHEDLLATIEQLKHENSVLQQTIYELQQEKQNQYPFCTSPGDVIHVGGTSRRISLGSLLAVI